MTVPAGATTGNVVVTVSNAPSNGVTFTVVPQGPTLSALTPVAGPTDAPVTIAGAGFGATQGSSTVTFNGIAASVTSWSATSIRTSVPTAATTGSVVVTVSGLPSSGTAFTVTPGIVSLSPQSSATGVTSPLTVTVTGSGFTAASLVMWNNSGRQTTYVSAATLNATITTSDLSAAGTFPVSVQTPGGGGSSGSMPFTVGTLAIPSKEYIRFGGRVIAIENPPLIAPSISSLTLADGPVGSSLTIAGANFGVAQGSSTVKFNGTSATVSTWSATGITVTVPAGATTGNVVVTVSGQASNGISFSVTP